MVCIGKFLVNTVRYVIAHHGSSTSYLQRRGDTHQKRRQHWCYHDYYSRYCHDSSMCGPMHNKAWRAVCEHVHVKISLSQSCTLSTSRTCDTEHVTAIVMFSYD